MNLYDLKDGDLHFYMHAGQQRAWDSDKRFVVVLAGTQSGKTSWLPWWLWNEIQVRGSGDYLAVTASYDLFKLKFLPVMLEVFCNITKIGKYHSSSRVIELRNPNTGEFEATKADDPMWGRIILRSAESGGGLESSTANAAILDEAGMDSFSEETWEAVLRRLSLKRGRAVIGTTIYNMGWLKTRIYDKWELSRHNHPEIDVVQFDSIENPAFPRQEFEERMADMPRWRFDMMYRGRFTRPAGMIYDCFDVVKNTTQRFIIPNNWERLLGLDFGGVNTAGVFFAKEPSTGVLYGYREYLEGGKTAAGHASDLLVGEIRRPRTTGGAKSEGQWRDEFRSGGLTVEAPDQPSVEVGISRVYGGLARGEVVFFDDLVGTIGQLNSYSRKLDTQGNPTEEILNKETYHYLDACRYVLGRYFSTRRGGSGLIATQAGFGPGTVANASAAAAAIDAQRGGGVPGSVSRPRMVAAQQSAVRRLAGAGRAIRSRFK